MITRKPKHHYWKRKDRERQEQNSFDSFGYFERCNRLKISEKKHKRKMRRDK